MDSSIVLRYLLVQDTTFHQASRYDAAGSSELLIIECNRVMDRHRLENRISDSELAEAKWNLRQILDGLQIVELTEPVKTRAAGAFPTVIGSLDAIHLASFLLWKDAVPEERFVLLTADQQMRTCAVSLGIEVG